MMRKIVRGLSVGSPRLTGCLLRRSLQFRPQLSVACVPAVQNSVRFASTTSSLPPALVQEIEEKIKADRIVLFLTGTPEAPRCRFTMMIVDMLGQLGIKYKSFDIMEDDEFCEGLKEYSNWPTYPQVYIDGELIGGYDSTKQMVLDGSFVKMLKEKNLV